MSAARCHTDRMPDPAPGERIVAASPPSVDPQPMRTFHLHRHQDDRPHRSRHHGHPRPPGTHRADIPMNTQTNSPPQLDPWSALISTVRGGRLGSTVGQGATGGTSRCGGCCNRPPPRRLPPRNERSTVAAGQPEISSVLRRHASWRPLRERQPSAFEVLGKDLEHLADLIR